MNLNHNKLLALLAKQILIKINRKLKIKVQKINLKFKKLKGKFLKIHNLRVFLIF